MVPSGRMSYQSESQPAISFLNAPIVGIRTANRLFAIHHNRKLIPRTSIVGVAISIGTEGDMPAALIENLVELEPFQPVVKDNRAAAAGFDSCDVNAVRANFE